MDGGQARRKASTRRSVASIGAAVGYPAETTFSRTFRRVIGQPPGRYRRSDQVAISVRVE